LEDKDQDAVEHQDAEPVLELFGVSRIGNLAQTLQQNRQHLAHGRDQPAHRLVSCCPFLFDALKARLAV
jgi:hypothetical protein